MWLFPNSPIKKRWAGSPMISIPSFNRFVRGEVNPFSAWHEHVPDWMDSKLASTPEFLLIRFEEMRRNTEETLVQVLDFLGVDVDRRVVTEAIANNTLKKMQEKEQKSPQLSNTAPNPNGSEESRFIRSGSIAGWRNRLTAEQSRLIEDKAGPVLERMGYPIGDAATQKQDVAAPMPSAVNM